MSPFADPKMTDRVAQPAPEESDTSKLRTFISILKKSEPTAFSLLAAYVPRTSVAVQSS